MSDLNLAKEMLTVQQDIHAALANNLLVQAELGDPPRLYDGRPEAPTYPYLTYGQSRSEETSGDAAQQSTHQITLHLWSRQNGRREALRLLRTISDAIRDGVTHTIVPLYLDVLTTPDGRTFHGLLRLSVITLQETSQ